MSRDPLTFFPNFLFKTWRTLGLPDPTPLQFDFAHYLDDHRAWRQILDEAERELRAGTSLTSGGARKILMAFRGAAKTYVATDYAVFRLREDRSEEVLVTSATDRHASNIATFAFQMVTGFDWLADMKPSSKQRQSALAFDVAGSPIANKDESFAASSIFGQITGRRSTLILADDVETPNTSETQTKRDQLKDRVGELGGAIIKPGGDILFLGTAQHEQTIYRTYADEKGYELRIYPVLYPIPSDDPKKDERLKYGARLAPLIATALKENPLLAGTSTEPTRFTEIDIAQRQLEWGRIEFERQFKMWMDAGQGTLNPLKLRDLIIMDIAPPAKGSAENVNLPAELQWGTLPVNRVKDIHVDALTGDNFLNGPQNKVDIWLPAEEVICFIDTSGEGEDETTWSIMASLGGRVFLLHQGASGEGSTDYVMHSIAADCLKWGVQLIQIESNFGGTMFGSLLRPQLTLVGSKADIEDVRSGRASKESRIVDTLEPIFTGHRLVINAEVLRGDFTIDRPDVEEARRRFFRLTYQITRMAKIKGVIRHDDRVDGLAGGAAHFAERLMRTLLQEAQKASELALERELEIVIAARKAAGLPIMHDQTPDTPLNRRPGHTKGDRR